MTDLDELEKARAQGKALNEDRPYRARRDIVVSVQIDDRPVKIFTANPESEAAVSQMRTNLDNLLAEAGAPLPE